MCTFPQLHDVVIPPIPCPQVNHLPSVHGTLSLSLSSANSLPYIRDSFNRFNPNDEIQAVKSSDLISRFDISASGIGFDLHVNTRLLRPGLVESTSVRTCAMSSQWPL